MTELEITQMRTALAALREAIFAVYPLDGTTQPDTAWEAGYVLGKLENLDFLLQRDLRAKAAGA